MLKMKSVWVWILGLLLFLVAQAAALASQFAAASDTVRRAGIDPAALEPDPKLFLLIGFGLLALGLVANRKYRS
jgi:hypothetical protein